MVIFMKHFLVVHWTFYCYQGIKVYWPDLEKREPIGVGKLRGYNYEGIGNQACIT